MSILALWLFFTVIPGLEFFLGFTAFFSLVAAVVALVIGCNNEPKSYNSDEENNLMRSTRSFCFKLSRNLIIYSIIAAFIGSFIPSEKSMYKIIGAYAVTNIEGIEQLPPNIVKAANNFLEGLIDKGDEGEGK
jgi:hypothetical protein